MGSSKLKCAILAGVMFAAGIGIATAQSLPGVEVKPSPVSQDRLDMPWPVAPADKAYAAIDGHHLHSLVEEITAISRRYRDNGHPQYWGRLEGLDSDEDSAKWMMAKLKAAGLQVRQQFFDLPPQWVPQSWTVSAVVDGKTTNFTSANPSAGSVGTDGKPLDLEVAYGGFGTESDFKGRDVKGKAVLLYEIPQPGVWGNTGNYDGGGARAVAKGAAAVLYVIAIPGNIGTMWPQLRGAKVPAFTMGLQDGDALRKAMEAAPADKPLHMTIALDVRQVPGLKTSTIWGTLPGMTDEKIFVVAHRDGYFEAAGDNASGMASAIGLAEYYAKIPKAQRKRTLIILGSAGHHGTAVSIPDLAKNKDTELANTALMINAEHTAVTQYYNHAGQLRASNMTNAEHWAFNGSPQLQQIAVKAFDSFGVATYEGTDGVADAEISSAAKLVPSLGVIHVDTFYHTDAETAAQVPWTGLAAITRAFAKVIDGVNKLPLKDLQPVD